MVLVVASLRGWIVGEPVKLVAPQNAYGDTCGVSSQVESNPYKFWSGLDAPDAAAVCVPRCPELGDTLVICSVGGRLMSSTSASTSNGGSEGKAPGVEPSASAADVVAVSEPAKQCFL